MQRNFEKLGVDKIFIESFTMLFSICTLLILLYS